MPRLADLPQLVGFLSYSREDDEGSGGKLSRLRERIQEELRGQLGRVRGDFRLWQDKAAIPHGKLWENEIKSAIAESVFFIPIITPTAVRSQHCRSEFELFLAREAELGRNDLVFPIHYIRVPALEDERQWRQDDVLNTIGRRQYIDWLKLRHLDVDSTEVGVTIERFCSNISRALLQPWSPPGDRVQTQNAIEQRRAAGERRDLEIEAEQHSDKEKIPEIPAGQQQPPDDQRARHDNAKPYEEKSQRRTKAQAEVQPRADAASRGTWIGGTLLILGLAVWMLWPEPAFDPNDPTTWPVDQATAVVVYRSLLENCPSNGWRLTKKWRIVSSNLDGIQCLRSGRELGEIRLIGAGVSKGTPNRALMLLVTPKNGPCAAGTEFESAGYCLRPIAPPTANGRG